MRWLFSCVERRRGSDLSPYPPLPAIRPETTPAKSDTARKVKKGKIEDVGQSGSSKIEIKEVPAVKENRSEQVTTRPRLIRQDTFIVTEPKFVKGPMNNQVIPSVIKRRHKSQEVEKRETKGGTCFTIAFDATEITDDPRDNNLWGEEVRPWRAREDGPRVTSNAEAYWLQC